jgi:cytochrome c-type biogenesis protein CcmH/NrfG
LTQEKNISEALKVLDKAIQMLPEKNPMRYLMLTKQALLTLQSDQEEARAQAMKMLESLANDQDNIYRDQALYYLGYVYHMNNNLEQAQVLWRQLREQFSGDREAESGWIQLAAEQLAE